jgi:hypothetical protein
MGPQQGFDASAERFIPGTRLLEKGGAVRAGWQFQRLVEQLFFACWLGGHEFRLCPPS